MEAHRVKHVISKHPLMPGYDVSYRKRPCVSGMKVSVKIGIGNGYEEFLSSVRFSLENSGFVPDFLPFFFDIVRFVFLLHSIHITGDNNKKLAVI